MATNDDMALVNSFNDLKVINIMLEHYPSSIGTVFSRVDYGHMFDSDSLFDYKSLILWNVFMNY